MKSQSDESRKVSQFFFMIIALFLCVLVGCSNENVQNETAQPTPTSETSELKTENERLRSELETANESLKELEQKIEELEAAMDTAPSETTPSQIDLVPPQRSSKELLVGEWFLPKFYEITEVDNYIISLVFNANGTGTQWRTFYLPSSLNAENYSTTDTVCEESYNFTWNLTGDTVHTEFGSNSEFVDYTFSSEQQQLLVISQNGVAPNQTHVYVREKPNIPEKYVERSVILKNVQVQEAALMRRFLGTWYFDLTVWTFNDDGTGICDIPELAGQPAVKQEFSYSAIANGTSITLAIEWADTSEIEVYWPKMNNDGSVNLNDAIKLTRTFDLDNCPISTEIISTGIGLFSGSIFTEILSGS